MSSTHFTAPWTPPARQAAVRWSDNLPDLETASYGNPRKTRQKVYRRRMQEGGCRQVTVWLNADAHTALQLLVASQQADASTVTSNAIRHYHAVTSDKPTVTSDKPAITRNRYMSQALEDHILALRQSGLSLSAVARQLADQGYLNAKGEPYDTSTVSKAEAHAKARPAE